jgi:thymidine kinase
MAMDLHLILGPMKSGKSFELISYFAPLKFTDIPYAVFQPEINVRDEHIWSRNGTTLQATKTKSLEAANPFAYQVIGIDEVHMFPESDLAVISELLKKGTKVVVSGLDIDYLWHHSRPAFYGAARG